MSIENNSKLTAQMQADFSLKLFMHSFKKKVIYVELISVAVIALVLIWYIEQFWWAIICGVFMIAFPLVTILVFKSGLNKMRKNGDEFEEVTNHFTFEENRLNDDITYDGNARQVSLDYAEFTQIIETKDLIVLIMKEQQAFFVEKSGFNTITDCEEVVKLLKAYPAYRYYK